MSVLERPGYLSSLGQYLRQYERWSGTYKPKGIPDGSILVDPANHYDIRSLSRNGSGKDIFEAAAKRGVSVVGLILDGDCSLKDFHLRMHEDIPYSIIREEVAPVLMVRGNVDGDDKKVIFIAGKEVSYPFGENLGRGHIIGLGGEEMPDPETTNYIQALEIIRDKGMIPYTHHTCTIPWKHPLRNRLPTDQELDVLEQIPERTIIGTCTADSGLWMEAGNILARELYDMLRERDLNVGDCGDSDGHNFPEVVGTAGKYIIPGETLIDIFEYPRFLAKTEYKHVIRDLHQGLLDEDGIVNDGMLDPIDWVKNTGLPQGPIGQFSGMMRNLFRF